MAQNGQDPWFVKKLAKAANAAASAATFDANATEFLGEKRRGRSDPSQTRLAHELPRAGPGSFPRRPVARPMMSPLAIGF